MSTESTIDKSQKLCPDIHQEIIGRVELREISSCSLVNKAWYRFAKEALDKIIVKETLTFDASVWNAYYGEVSEEPPLPKSLVNALKSPCPFFKKKRKFETHLLCLIPQTVGNVPLTIDLFEKLVQKPKKGSSSKIGHVCHFTQQAYRKKSPKQSYWILMVKKIVKGSIGRPFYWSQVGKEVNTVYRQPTILEALSCLFLKHVSCKRESCVNLLGKKSGAYIWCEEKMKENSIVIGCDKQWEEAKGGLLICLAFKKYLVGYQPALPLLNDK